MLDIQVRHRPLLRGAVPLERRAGRLLARRFGLIALVIVPFLVIVAARWYPELFLGYGVLLPTFGMVLSSLVAACARPPEPLSNVSVLWAQIVRAVRGIVATAAVGVGAFAGLAVQTAYEGAKPRGHGAQVSAAMDECYDLLVVATPIVLTVYGLGLVASLARVPALDRYRAGYRATRFAGRGDLRRSLSELCFVVSDWRIAWVWFYIGPAALWAAGPSIGEFLLGLAEGSASGG